MKDPVQNPTGPPTLEPNTVPTEINGVKTAHAFKRVFVSYRDRVVPP
jgi:hypothetical protein